MRDCRARSLSTAGRQDAAAPIVTVTANDSCPPTNPLRWCAASLLLIHLSSSTGLPLPISILFGIFFSGEGPSSAAAVLTYLRMMFPIGTYTCTHTHGEDGKARAVAAAAMQPAW